MFSVKTTTNSIREKRFDRVTLSRGVVQQPVDSDDDFELTEYVRKVCFLNWIGRKGNVTHSPISMKNIPRARALLLSFGHGSFEGDFFVIYLLIGKEWPEWSIISPSNMEIDTFAEIAAKETMKQFHRCQKKRRKRVKEKKGKQRDLVRSIVETRRRCDTIEASTN